MNDPKFIRGYAPLDLHGVYNRSVEVFEDSHEVTLGNRTLYGLPFEFGTEEAAVVLVPGNGGSASLPVGGEARWFIFAHAVLDTDLYTGGQIGDPVGEYTLTYADGTSHAVPVRQRFEIGPTPRKWTGRALPLDWGQTPFLAYNDAEHELMDRTCGRFDEAGARFVDIADPQSKVPYVLPYRFYLWALQNPHPGKVVEHIDIEATGQSLLIGAITLSQLDEEPFTRAVAQDLLIALDQGVMDETVSVRVDRGTATYVYRTSPSPAGELPAGWGAPADQDWKTGYAKVAASPSARVSLHRGPEKIGAFLWGDLQQQGALLLDSGTTVRLAPAGQTWVKTTVRDAVTGEPLPCRLRFQTPDGVPVAPYGHHAHINSDGETWNLDIGGDVRLGAYTYAFIDGSCEGWLPTGPLVVEASRGFEYVPLRETVVIGDGQTELILELERNSDARHRGYYSGDTHVHFVSTQGAELEARAEDTDVVNLLLTQWGHLYTSTEEFTGRPHLSADGRTAVFAGQENRTNMLGHINLLGLREPIMPWCTGGSEEAAMGGGLETTLSHWADECHAQGGTVVLAHFPVPYGETAALLATGRLDAVETIAYDDYNFSEYYRYLNAGYQIPLAAGTDKMTSEVPIGMMRTYAHIGTDASFDYWAWCEGIKRGDTTVSSGPLLWLSVDGHRPGAQVALGASGLTRAEINLDTVFPIGSIQLLLNGHVLHEEAVPSGSRHHSFRVDLQVTEDSWVAARCFGTGPQMLRHNDNWNRPVMAHTSPVYLTRGDRYDRFDPVVTRNMLDIVEGAARYVEERSRRFWAGPVSHRHGETDHLAYLLRPFAEAKEALENRLNTCHK